MYTYTRLFPQTQHVATQRNDGNNPPSSLSNSQPVHQQHLSKFSRHNKHMRINASAKQSLPQPTAGQLAKQHERLQTAYNTPLRLFSLSGERDVTAIFKSLQDAGFPLYDNGILSPKDIPGNWMLHYKDQENEVIEKYSQKLGQAPDSMIGYVCSRSEANQFAIRTLMEGLQQAYPNHLPMLLGSEDADIGVVTAHQRFTIPYKAIPTDATGAMDLNQFNETLQSLPKESALIVVISSLTRNGGKDNRTAIAQLCQAKNIPYALHLDCTYDFLQTPLLTIQSTPMGLPDVNHPDRIGSITAGSLIFQEPPVCAVLCARDLAQARENIQYIRGKDATLSGSRPAILALKMWLIGEVFNENEYQKRQAVVAGKCKIMQQELSHLNIQAEHISGTGWLRIATERLSSKNRQFIETVGGLVGEKFSLLQISPLLDNNTAYLFLRNLAHGMGVELPRASWVPTSLATYTPPQLSKSNLELLEEFANRSSQVIDYSMGYPGNQATMPQLAPLAGPYLPCVIPEQATKQRTKQIIHQWTQTIAKPYPSNMLGMITTGGTEGIAIGLINALEHFKSSETIHIYISNQAHYSIKRIARDNQRVRNGIRIINTTKDGAIDPQHFLTLLKKDTQDAQVLRQNTPRCLLFCSHETTFTGAFDNLVALHDTAKQINRKIDYIHLDGALGLGHSFNDLTLYDVGSAPPSETLFANSVSASSHKFPGLQVGGIVAAAAPPYMKHLIGLKHQVDPMAAVLADIYLNAYPVAKRKQIRLTCEENTMYLRQVLQAYQFQIIHPVSRNIITAFQSPPNWLEDRYNLANEDGLAHIVMMPHIDKELIDTFVESLYFTRLLLENLENDLNASCQKFLPDYSIKILTRRCNMPQQQHAALNDFWTRIKPGGSPPPFQQAQNEEIFIQLTHNNNQTVNALAVNKVKEFRLEDNVVIYADDTILSTEKQRLEGLIKYAYDAIQQIITNTTGPVI